MAETQKLTIDKNNFLVYQTINDEGDCTAEKRLTPADFADPIPLEEPENSNFYYLNLDWEKEDDNDYLGLEGKKFQLHEIAKDEESDVPSVIPKTAKFYPSYWTTDGKNGYTLSHFKLNENANLYVDNGNNYTKCDYHFDLENNWNHVEVEEAADKFYDDEEIKNDKYWFNSNGDFDGRQYIENDNTIKIINEPIQNFGAGKCCYHELNFHVKSGEINLYYKNEYATTQEDTYKPITKNISLVTFLPLKRPSSYSTTYNYDYKRKWVLCVYCRGEGAADDWYDVADPLNPNPRRTKMEWRPLHIPTGTGYFKTIELYEEDYLDFFKRNEYDEAPPTEEIDNTDKLPDPIYQKVKTIDIKIYNVDYNKDKDETGLLYDNRNIEDGQENTIPFYANDILENTYFVNRESYYFWENLKGGITTRTENSFILMDCDGYCLFCPELMEQWGIGFIKSTWVYRNDKGQLYVKVHKEELEQSYDFWGNESGYAFGDVDNGRIYSSKYLNLDADEGIHRLTRNNDYKGVNEYNIDESLIYNYFDEYYNHQNYLVIDADLSIEKWEEIVQCRIGKMEKPVLKSSQKLADSASDNHYKQTLEDAKIAYHTDTEYYDIVVWKQTDTNTYKSNGEIVSHFVRYRVLKPTTLTDIGPQITNVAYWIKDSETNEERLYTIYGEDPNQDTWWENPSDRNNNTPVYDYYNNYGYLIRKPLYIITYTIVDDIEYKKANTVLPNTWTAYINWRKGKFAQNKIKVIKAERDVDKSQEEILDNELNNGIYRTPMEWYSEYNQLIDDDNEDILKDQNWFWLDTLSNWCKFEIEPDKTSVELRLWDGQGNWVSSIEMLSAFIMNDDYQLKNKYLYDKKFFKIGPVYPPVYNVHLYVPMNKYLRIYSNNADARDGQMRYSTLILSKDSKTVLYKSRMNLDYAKVYYHEDYNSYARANYGDAQEGQIRQAERDEKRRFVIGSETQPIPCIIRLANGNLAICYDFVAETNGISRTELRNIVNTTNEKTGAEYEEYCDELNKNCKKIFGDGASKTIAKDWKRYITFDDTEEFSSDIRYVTDESIYGAASLNTIPVGKIMSSISITAPRPNPTTNNKTIEDYIERWDK